jgi:beta-glucanase (GH16 family)
MTMVPALLLALAAVPRPAPGYHLVFNEGFDHLDLSPDGTGTHTWHEGVWFNPTHAPLSNISCSSSGLTLVWRRGQEASDTSITTLSRDFRHSQAWRYGYFEARMKWDVTPGAWPALWLIPVPDAKGKATYRDTEESGELDIFEGQGSQPHTFFGTVHDWIRLHDYPSRNNSFPLPVTADLAQYHTYGLLWVPGKVTWYLDNRPLHSEIPPAIFHHQDYFMVISMQEGADWKPGNLTHVEAMQMTLSVDWVHVWQK